MVNTGTSSSRWLLLDFDNCQMTTEHLAVPSLIERFNDLYGDKIDHLLTLQEFKEHFHGQARESLCNNLSDHFGIPIDYPTLYEAREWRMMQHLKKTGVEMAAHLINTLSILELQGYKFALVSNNPIQRALTAMRFATNGQGEQLARFFGTAFFEAGDIQKPKPDVYLRAMEQLDVSPQMCIAVEDSATGASAAVSAGIQTFGFTGLADDPQITVTKLKEKGVKTFFHDWTELPVLLEFTLP